MKKKIKEMIKSDLKLILRAIILLLIITLISGLGFFTYYFIQSHKKTSLEIKEPRLEDIEVKNDGLDPKDLQDKKILDEFKLSLVEPEVLKAKIITRKVLGKEELAKGTDFIIFDFRNASDFNKKKIDYSINVTLSNLTYNLSKYDTKKIIYLVSYAENDDKIQFSTKASLMQGYFSILALKDGFKGWQNLESSNK